jgi:hypothetical protein
MPKLTELVLKVRTSINELVTSMLTSLYVTESVLINPLKTKLICFIQELSAYHAVNTLHFGYKNQSLNVL